MNVANCNICNLWSANEDLQIMEFANSLLMLNRDQFFPGYCLLFTRRHQTELFKMETALRQELTEEVSLIASVLAEVFNADKMNYELLGNMSPHIHWHLIPRHSSDPLWPQPIWAKSHDELVLSAEQNRERAGIIRQAVQRKIT